MRARSPVFDGDIKLALASELTDIANRKCDAAAHTVVQSDINISSHSHATEHCEFKLAYERMTKWPIEWISSYVQIVSCFEPL